ncbi:MAG: rhomboid family intramembrane serine protease [Candidatus Obscuribacterales bacterium]|nr:rhomboid family intramembrane serine protease [Candidatus Obscuribacterales bacterium]
MSLTLRAPVTLTLVLANVCAWLIFCAGDTAAEDAINRLGFSPLHLTQSLNQGDFAGVAAEGLRSVSQLFVHSNDFAHVGLNMLVLVLFGIAVERRLGSRKYAALFFLSGVLTCLAYALICPDGRTCLGASAAVFAVMGAFAYLKARERSLLAVLPFGLVALNMKLATNGAILQALGFGPWAHAIGFMLGLLLALLIAPRRVAPAPPTTPALVATAQ